MRTRTSRSCTGDRLTYSLQKYVHQYFINAGRIRRKKAHPARLNLVDGVDDNESTLAIQSRLSEPSTAVAAVSELKLERVGAEPRAQLGFGQIRIERHRSIQ